MILSLRNTFKEDDSVQLGCFVVFVWGFSFWLFGEHSHWFYISMYMWCIRMCTYMCIYVITCSDMSSLITSYLTYWGWVSTWTQNSQIWLSCIALAIPCVCLLSAGIIHRLTQPGNLCLHGIGDLNCSPHDTGQTLYLSQHLSSRF